MANTVLVVDQDPAARKSIEVLLDSQGYQVAAVGCSEDACRYLETRTPAVVLTALKLFGADGFTLCRFIKRLPFTSVVYAVSAYLQEYGVDQLINAGFDGHLKKPINANVVAAAVRGAFDRLNNLNN